MFSFLGMYTLYVTNATLQVNVEVHHVLSVEIEEFKRKFILAAHTKPGKKHEFCLFDDVKIFNMQKAWCYSCEREHSVDVNLDLLLSGPSCKGNSYENKERSKYANCYATTEGCSGGTYEFGFRTAIERTCPAIALFENTVGVSHGQKDQHGVKYKPKVEAWFAKKIPIYFNINTIFYIYTLYMYIWWKIYIYI